SAESGQPGADPPGDPEFNAKTRGRQDAKKRREIREFFVFLRLCVIATLRLNPALSSFDPGCHSPLLAFAEDRAELRRARSVTLKGVVCKRRYTRSAPQGTGLYVGLHVEGPAPPGPAPPPSAGRLSPVFTDGG